jgi:surface protein
MFQSAGYKVTNWSVGDLSSWNTSNVTNMSYMFASAGYSTTSLSLDLSGWDTSKVTNMSYMFESCGANAKEVSIEGLSNWDTSKVTTMKGMFQQFAMNTDNPTDIGTFKLPDGVVMDSFAEDACRLSAAFILSGSASSSTSAFLNAASAKDGDDATYISDITLIPTSETVETEIKTNYIAAYGIIGTSSTGNIHLPYLDIEIRYADVFRITSDSKEAEDSTVSGATITITNRSKYTQVQTCISVASIAYSGWSLVSKYTDFASMHANTKAVSLVATTDAGDSVDLSNTSIELILKENDGTDSANTVTFDLTGKTSLFTKKINEAESFCVITIEFKRLYLYESAS